MTGGGVGDAHRTCVRHPAAYQFSTPLIADASRDDAARRCRRGGCLIYSARCYRRVSRPAAAARLPAARSPHRGAAFK